MERSDEFNPPPANWLLRAYYTPVSDALRGHLSGRLDVRREIAAAELPKPVAGLIHTVVRRTRLWRREKSDVVRELIAHFADGLAAGRSAEQLVADFGPADQAAKLIRQAKRRNRPLYWQAWWYFSRGLLALIAAATLGYVVLAARFYLAAPDITRNYWHEINAPRRIAEDERAWPLYRAAIVKLGKEDSELLEKHPDARPGSKDWPELVAVAERHGESIALAREGAAKSHFGYLLGDPADGKTSAAWVFSAKAPRADDNPELISALLEGLQALRQLARLVAADAWRAAAAADGTVTLADLSALLSMSAQTFQPRATLVEQLVGYAIFTQATENVRSILADFPDVLSDSQLRDLAHEIAAWRRGAMPVDFAGERIMFDDVLQRVYTDDGRGDGRLTDRGLSLLPELLDFNNGMSEPVRWEKLLGPGLAAVVGSRRDNHELFNSHLDEMIALHQGPAWTWDHDAIDAANQRLYELFNSATGKVRYLFAGLMLPAIQPNFSNAELSVQRRDATEVAIALVLWHRKHGAWPQTLAELVPELLPAVGPDRFDGQPLRYVIRDGHPLVYSIGQDRDDDGGTAWGTPYMNYDRMSEASLMRLRNRGISPEGDWVLWPPPPGPAEPEPAE
ncbi:MAG: hypothetical protein WD063_15995 [Pirellulales bacterium]